MAATATGAGGCLPQTAHLLRLQVALSTGRHLLSSALPRLRHRPHRPPRPEYRPRRPPGAAHRRQGEDRLPTGADDAARRRPGPGHLPFPARHRAPLPGRTRQRQLAGPAHRPRRRPARPAPSTRPVRGVAAGGRAAGHPRQQRGPDRAQTTGVLRPAGGRRARRTAPGRPAGPRFHPDAHAGARSRVPAGGAPGGRRGRAAAPAAGRTAPPPLRGQRDRRRRAFHRSQQDGGPSAHQHGQGRPQHAHPHQRGRTRRAGRPHVRRRHRLDHRREPGPEEGPDGGRRLPHPPSTSSTARPACTTRSCAARPGTRCPGCSSRTTGWRSGERGRVPCGAGGQLPRSLAGSGATRRTAAARSLFSWESSALARSRWTTSLSSPPSSECAAARRSRASRASGRDRRAQVLDVGDRQREVQCVPAQSPAQGLPDQLRPAAARRSLEQHRPAVAQRRPHHPPYRARDRRRIGHAHGRRDPVEDLGRAVPARSAVRTRLGQPQPLAVDQRQAPAQRSPEPEHAGSNPAAPPRPPSPPSPPFSLPFTPHRTGSHAGCPLARHAGRGATR